MRSRTRPLIALVATLAVLTGCSSVPDYDPPPTPAPVTASVPSDGMTLRELGAEYGPVDAVVVPREHRLQLLISQINLVNVVFDAPDADELAAWFRRELPRAGWTITDDAGGALLFTGHGWEGAFTPMGDGSPGGAFSLRKQGQ
ncbi:hypothetical protein [Enemella sp. A6]|uniref:hypothetical protein n=1 Tax=Enemella sp. A6 TaxID=3440152 RepID=UPI003EBA81A4